MPWLDRQQKHCSGVSIFSECHWSMFRTHSNTSSLLKTEDVDRPENEIALLDKNQERFLLRRDNRFELCSLFCSPYYKIRRG